MNMEKIFLAIFIFIFTHIVFAQNTIILQQGLNGYTGCEDTYLHIFEQDSLSSTTNHCNDTDLFIKECPA